MTRNEAWAVVAYCPGLLHWRHLTTSLVRRRGLRCAHLLFRKYLFAPSRLGVIALK